MDPVAEPDLPVGARIKDHRERVGMSRPALAGLVGKSAEWVKAPGLIRDAQRAVRTVGAYDRRAARRALAGVYRLADFYVAYQPAQELVWLVADRALTEAYEADDPCAIAGGAWAMVGALRDTRRPLGRGHHTRAGRHPQHRAARGQLIQPLRVPVHPAVRPPHVSRVDHRLDHHRAVVGQPSVELGTGAV